MEKQINENEQLDNYYDEQKETSEQSMEIEKESESNFEFNDQEKEEFQEQFDKIIDSIFQLYPFVFDVYNILSPFLRQLNKKVGYTIDQYIQLCKMGENQNLNQEQDSNQDQSQNQYFQYLDQNQNKHNFKNVSNILVFFSQFNDNQACEDLNKKLQEQFEIFFKFSQENGYQDLESLDLLMENEQFFHQRVEQAEQLQKQIQLCQNQNQIQNQNQNQDQDFCQFFYICLDCKKIQCEFQDQKQGHIYVQLEDYLKFWEVFGFVCNQAYFKWFFLVYQPDPLLYLFEANEDEKEKEFKKKELRQIFDRVLGILEEYFQSQNQNGFIMQQIMEQDQNLDDNLNQNIDQNLEVLKNNCWLKKTNLMHFIQGLIDGNEESIVLEVDSIKQLAKLYEKYRNQPDLFPEIDIYEEKIDIFKDQQ